jgi:endonuclease YncB( thermonuclease family)
MGHRLLLAIAISLSLFDSRLMGGPPRIPPRPAPKPKPPVMPRPPMPRPRPPIDPMPQPFPPSDPVHPGNQGAGHKQGGSNRGRSDRVHGKEGHGGGGLGNEEDSRLTHAPSLYHINPKGPQRVAPHLKNLILKDASRIQRHLLGSKHWHEWHHRHRVWVWGVYGVVPDFQAGKVVGVPTGNSLDVNAGNGKVRRVRLAGVGAPLPGQPFFSESRESLSGMAEGETVRVFQVATDDDEAIIGQVFRETGECLNEMQVNSGFAWNDVDDGYDETLAMAEQGAQDSGLGMWSVGGESTAVESEGKARSGGSTPQTTPPAATVIQVRDVFRPLFEGTNLQGWSDLEENGSHWTMSNDGVLTGNGTGVVGGRAVLLSNRTDYRNLTLKLRVLNAGGDHCRRIHVRHCTKDDMSSGYAIKLSLPSNDAGQSSTAPIGSIKKMSPKQSYDVWDVEATPPPIGGGEWYDLEISAIGNRIVTVVNGRKAAEYTDPVNSYSTGGLAFACLFDATIQVKNLEIKELPDDDQTKTKTSLSGQLQKAKARWQTAQEQAQRRIASRFDKAIARLDNSTERDLAAAMKRQKEIFLRRGFLPWSSSMRDARTAYEQAMESAASQLRREFEKAISKAKHDHDDEAVEALVAEEEVALAPKIIGICDCVMGNRKFRFFLFSNHTIQNPDGPGSWTLNDDQLVITNVTPNSPPEGFIDTCTIDPEGSTFSAVNQSGGSYSGRFLER